jgi:hypothetical protein
VWLSADPASSASTPLDADAKTALDRLTEALPASLTVSAYQEWLGAYTEQHNRSSDINAIWVSWTAALSEAAPCVLDLAAASAARSASAQPSHSPDVWEANTEPRECRP